MADELNALHGAVGELRGQVEMLIGLFKDEASESSKSRARMHEKIETVHQSAREAVNEGELLKARVAKMEPILADYQFLKERFKTYLAIAVLAWAFMSAVLAPVIGGFLQKLLYGI